MKNFSGLTITGATPDGYSVKANGYVKGSWLQSSVMQNYGSNTGKVCVFDNSGWIYYRTPAEILAEAGGGASTEVVQTTGTSTTSVMSQKAVTDELGKKANSSDLAAVATSGSYNDLSYKPTIPTKTSQLTNDSDYATTSQVNAKYTKPSGGIPKTDLASDVQTSLGKADAALSIDGGTINKSKTVKMDASANSNGANLKWGTVNSKNPYIGYASDQVDGTFVVGSLLGTNYASGLAIGGGSGNLLWKGAKVATTSDIPNISGKLDKSAFSLSGTTLTITI